MEPNNEDRYEALKAKIISGHKDKQTECINSNSDTGTHFIQGAARELAGLIEFIKILDGETQPTDEA